MHGCLPPGFFQEGKVRQLVPAPVAAPSCRLFLGWDGAPQKRRGIVQEEPFDAPGKGGVSRAEGFHGLVKMDFFLQENVARVQSRVDTVDGHAFGRIIQKAPEIGVTPSVPGQKGDVQIDQVAGKKIDDIGTHDITIAVRKTEVKAALVQLHKGNRRFLSVDSMAELRKPTLKCRAWGAEEEDIHRPSSGSGALVRKRPAVALWRHRTTFAAPAPSTKARTALLAAIRCC